MDPNSLPDTQQILATPSRKRGNRENETPQQRIKREKAAERQRRKRERDRNAAGLGLISYQAGNEPQVEHTQHLQSALQQGVPQAAPPSQPTANPDLTPEEAARRERVRAAARERQRKHRLLVKQRKMRELGLEMPPEMIQDVHFRVNPEAQYHQVLQHELQQQQIEPPFPQGPPIGGQTFASTLLLSFSCTPLLKQHLLRTLNMTNEELASLEPIIAEAWDHWDHQRRLHGHPGSSAFSVEIGPEHALPPNHPYPAPVTASADPSHPSNEFRARFHRSLVAPTPFRTFAEAQATAASSTPASTTGSVQATPDSAVDPHLGTQAQSVSVATSEGGS